MEDTDEVAEPLKWYFGEEDALPEMDFVKQEVVIKMRDHGKQGTKEYTRSYDMNTTALEHKFGIAKHFVIRSSEGKTDNDDTKYLNI